MQTTSSKPFAYETFPSSGLVAYFSMEIAINPSMPTYSGGLGVLAGDTLRSAADLGIPLVAFTLLHRKGYFQQHLDPAGGQTEEVQSWNPSDFCAEEAARDTWFRSTCSTPISTETPAGIAASQTISTAATPTTDFSRKSCSAWAECAWPMRSGCK